MGWQMPRNFGPEGEGIGHATTGQAPNPFPHGVLARAPLVPHEILAPKRANQPRNHRTRTQSERGLGSIPRWELRHTTIGRAAHL